MSSSTDLHFLNFCVILWFFKWLFFKFVCYLLSQFIYYLFYVNTYKYLCYVILQ